MVSVLFMSGDHEIVACMPNCLPSKGCRINELLYELVCVSLFICDGFNIIIYVVSRGVMRHAASSYAAMRMMAGSCPMLVIA